MVKWIDPAIPESSSPSQGVVSGGTLFFTAGTSDRGTELYKTDGTSNGTVLVKDIDPGSDSSGPRLLTDVNGTLFFVAYDPQNELALWKSDGTESGTVLVRNLTAGADASWISSLINVNGTLFFTVNDKSLWKSDGTSDGTVLVKTLESISSDPTSHAAIGGSLYFVANDGSTGTELWKSDGTEAGTVLLKDIRAGAESSFPRDLVNFSGRLFFSANDGVLGAELWTSDGSTNGTGLFVDLSVGVGSANPRNFTNLDGVLYFAAKIGDSQQLWISDGTVGGTTLVKTLRNTISDFGTPFGFTKVNGAVYFSGADDVGNGALYKTDGTETGTVVLKSSIFPTYLTVLNNALYFAASDATAGVELWTSDGTADGTVRFVDIAPGQKSSYPSYLMAFNGNVVFTANELTHGQEIWTSNGTVAGTGILKDINSTISHSANPDRFQSLNGKLVFSAANHSGTSDLWVSDGSDSGTSVIGNVVPVVVSAQQGIGPYVYMNGSLYFVGNDALLGQELWKTDGTPSGTRLVVDLYPGELPSYPTYLTPVGDTLYFSAIDPVYGGEPRKSDGTASGTTILKDISPGSSGSGTGNLVNVNGTLFFSAAKLGSPIRQALWKSDGTAAGTVVVQTVNVQQPMVNNNGLLYFVGVDATHGAELWRSDGTPAGTYMVKDIVTGAGSPNLANFLVVNGVLYFTANDGIHGVELWKSDGTEAGTVMVRDINSSGSASSDPSKLANVNGVVYFRADDGVAGSELWKSDGTAAGTVMVKDINPGPSSSFPGWITNLNGETFFAASDGVHGYELWKSDGTEPGTIMVQDIGSGTGGSTWNVTAVDSKLFFAAATPDAGAQVWVYSPGTILASLDAGVLTLSDLGGASHSMTVSRAGNTLSITDATGTFDTIPSGGTLSADEHTLSFDLSATTISQIVISGGGLADSLTVDFSTGNPIPSGGLAFHGGNPTTSPGDALTLIGGNPGSVTFNETNAQDGSVTMSNFGTITYTGVELLANQTAPRVTSITPAFGPTTGGTLVTILGSNLTGADTVRFGTVAANFIVNSDSQITATAPSQPNGATSVVVSRLGVASEALATTTFTYSGSPAVAQMVVNGGDMYAINSYGVAVSGLAGQNSIVTQLYVEFDTGVTLDAGAFTLDAGPVTQSIPATGTTPVAAGTNVVSILAEPQGLPATNGGYKGYRLRFSGSSAYLNTFDNGPTGTGGLGNIATALRDGFYQLKIAGAKVHAGASLTGPSMNNDVVNGFWVMYGSVDPSDRDVAGEGHTGTQGDGTSIISTNASAIGFSQTNGRGHGTSLTGYNAAFDWNLDGDVGDDLIEFAKRFGAEWRF